MQTLLTISIDLARTDLVVNFFLPPSSFKSHSLQAAHPPRPPPAHVKAMQITNRSFSDFVFVHCLGFRLY
jgi:hypothetical protein